MSQEIISAQNARASDLQQKAHLWCITRFSPFPSIFQCIDVRYTHPKHSNPYILSYDTDIIIIMQHHKAETLYLTSESTRMN